MRFLYFYLLHQFFRRQFVISVKENTIHLVLLPSIDFVYNENLVWLFLEVCGHLGIVEAFLLEVVGQVTLPFLNQIQIDGPFGVNRDELLHLPSGQKWNGCQPGADRADGDHRSQFHFERDIYSIGFGVVLWWVFVNASSQPVLLAQGSFPIWAPTVRTVTTGPSSTLNETSTRLVSALYCGGFS